MSRASPSQAGKPVNRYKPLSIVSVLEGTKGWARVKPFTNDAQTEAEGRIPADPDFLITDDCFSAVLRRTSVEEHKWPTPGSAAVSLKPNGRNHVDGEPNDGENEPED